MYIGVSMLFYSSSQIIRQEEMVSSISTLMALCEKADNDIRACLNTLQVSIPFTTSYNAGSVLSVDFNHYRHRCISTAANMNIMYPI